MIQWNKPSAEKLAKSTNAILPEIPLTVYQKTLLRFMHKDIHCSVSYTRKIFGNNLSR
jgi:hypothetical protein